MPLWVAIFERLDLKSETGKCRTEICAFTEMLAEFESSDKGVGQSAVTLFHRLVLLANNQ